MKRCTHWIITQCIGTIGKLNLFFFTCVALRAIVLVSQDYRSYSVVFETPRLGVVLIRQVKIKWGDFLGHFVITIGLYG